MKRQDLYWNRVIRAAKARLDAGREPFSSAHILAASKWTTCACGRLDDGVPRRPWGEPMDDTLARYGERFMSAVVDQNPALAEKTLAKIEARAVKVLSAELGK